MRNNKFNTILLTLFFLVSLSGCKNNQSVTPQGQLENKNNTSIRESKQQAQTKTEPPSSQQPPAPKTEPKEAPKEAPKPAPKKESPKKITEESRVLASFNTIILDSESNRVSNIRLAAQKINGYILKPGETFSFNEVVGKRNYENGYKKSRILVNGKGDEGVGGGICQLSSTLYNAAEKSGLEIIERHSHSGEVSYVPRGRDAAVSYGYKDLKFKNINSYPVKLSVSVKNGKVYASISKVK